MKKETTVAQKIKKMLLKIVSPEFYVIYFAFVLPGLVMSLSIIGALLGNISAPFVVIGISVALGIGILWALLAGFMYAPILTGFIILCLFVFLVGIFS